jgi:hypothetical protein
MGSGLAVSLVPTNLHWLTEPPDDKADLCAHSAVEFFIGGEALVSANEGDWTVSASAVYLLRTLSSSHTKATPVGDHLFPCCGHTMYAMDDQEDVYISGCPNGKDFEDHHEADALVIRCDEGRSRVVSS